MAERERSGRGHIVVVGSINTDISAYLTDWPKPGETVAANGGRVALGGKGANQAIAAARLGAKVCMIGAVGDDVHGADAVDRLRSEGVQPFVDLVPDEPTGFALIDLIQSGANVIRVVAGANARLTAAWVEAHAKVFTGAAVVLLQNEVPLEATLAAARLGRAAGAFVILDPAPALSRPMDRSELALFDCLTPNESEASALLPPDCGLPASPAQQAQLLHDLGLRSVILTLGAQGAYWSANGGQGHTSARRVPAVDTVGAGDCFNGGLAVALLEGQGLEATVAFASDAAALATCRHGAADATPMRTELDLFRRTGQIPAIVRTVEPSLS